MKGISGVIGGVVVIILLLVVISITLAAMNYAYGVQQIEAKTFMSQLSQPHVAQVSPDSVMASGRLVASYIIYPNGRVALLNETVSGIRSFQSYLDGNPWAVVVFSNGQWINVSNMQNQLGALGYGSYLVPYYPRPIDPQNTAQLACLFAVGTEYNLPLTFPVNVSFQYSYKTINVPLNHLSYPYVYGFGRILEIPVVDEDGWLNFTVVNIYDSSNMSFAVLVQNSSGTLVVIHVNFDEQTHNISYGIYQYIIYPISSLPTGYTTVPINPYKTSEPAYPIYLLRTDISYTLYNASISESPIMKVAIKFSQGQPAQMYLWAGYYNGSGISWYRVLLPGFNSPTGSEIGYALPITEASGPNVYVIGYKSHWLDTNSLWPVNIYTEYVNETTVFAGPGIATYAAYNMYGEPLVPEPGSVIEVVPYWQDAQYATLIFNVTYSI